jgi:hypothetical protein
VHAALAAGQQVGHEIQLSISNQDEWFRLQSASDHAFRCCPQLRPHDGDRDRQETGIRCFRVLEPQRQGAVQMGVVKSQYERIWDLERKIIKTEVELDELKAQAKRLNDWLWATFTNFDKLPNPEGVLKEFSQRQKLGTTLDAEVAKKAKLYDQLRKNQNVAGKELQQYIEAKLQKKEGIAESKKAYYVKIVDEMKRNFK